MILRSIFDDFLIEQLFVNPQKRPKVLLRLLRAFTYPLLNVGLLSIIGIIRSKVLLIKSGCK